MIMTDKRNIYTTLDGLEIPIKSISPTKLMKAELGIEKSFRDKNEPIDTPTYDVETAGGGKETYDLDAESIQVPDNEEETAKRQADWDAHQDALLRLKKKQYDITSKIVLNAIDIPLPEDETWIKEQEDLYIEVPEDPYDRWFHWLETEVLHPTDVINLVAEILTLSATGIIPEEEVDAAVALFRSTVRTQSEEPEEQENTSGEDAEEEGSLGSQPVDAGSDDSESLGTETE
jgi:hypothetical protein